MVNLKRGRSKGESPYLVGGKDGDGVEGSRLGSRVTTVEGSRLGSCVKTGVKGSRLGSWVKAGFMGHDWDQGSRPGRSFQDRVAFIVEELNYRR